MADMQDLKSCGPHGPCRFESGLVYKMEAWVSGLNRLFAKEVAGNGTKVRTLLLPQKNERESERKGSGLQKRLGKFDPCRALSLVLW